MRNNSFELDQSRYCRYHNSVGHNTDECRDFLLKFSRLIERGHLRKYLVPLSMLEGKTLVLLDGKTIARLLPPVAGQVLPPPGPDI